MWKIFKDKNEYKAKEVKVGDSIKLKGHQVATNLLFHSQDNVFKVLEIKKSEYESFSSWKLFILMDGKGKSGPAYFSQNEIIVII